MKSLILISVLAAFTVCNGASIPDEVAPVREDAPVFKAGSIDRQGDFVILDQWYFRDTNGNNTVTFDIEYIGNVTTRVTGVVVHNPPQATVPGPLGNKDITIRLATAPGRELAARVILFGQWVY